MLTKKKFEGGSEASTVALVQWLDQCRQQQYSPFNLTMSFVPRDLTAGVCAVTCIACASQGIGLTAEKKLIGGDTVSYKALSASSATYKDRVSPFSA